MEWGDDIDSLEEDKKNEGEEKEILRVKIPLSSKRKAAAAKAPKKTKKKGRKIALNDAPLGDDNDDVEIVEPKSQNTNVESSEAKDTEEIKKFVKKNNDEKDVELNNENLDNKKEIDALNDSLDKNKNKSEDENANDKNDEEIDTKVANDKEYKHENAAKTFNIDENTENKETANDVQVNEIETIYEHSIDQTTKNEEKIEIIDFDEIQSNEGKANTELESAQISDTKESLPVIKLPIDQAIKNEDIIEILEATETDKEQSDANKTTTEIESKNISDTKESLPDTITESKKPTVTSKDALPEKQSEKSDDSTIAISDDDGDDAKKAEGASPKSNSENRRSSKRISTMDLTPKTPKLNSSVSADSLTGRKLTPKQLQKKIEAEKRNDERLRAKEERDRKIEEDKERKRQAEEERKREKHEKEMDKKREREEKEAERKRERDEKEAEKKREKEEKEKKRLEEINQKNEEKRKKDEQKEEERRKREEERIKKEEEQKLKEQQIENKKKKAAEIFSKFFKSKSTDRRISNDEGNSMSSISDLAIGSQQNFMPFRVKENMKIAPLVRKPFDSDAKDKLDEILKIKSFSTKLSDMWVNEIKSPNYKKGRNGRTWIPNLEEDIMIVEDELGEAADDIDLSQPKQTYRAKFLAFNENRRPPYYGTWRKRSTKINPRRPFESDKIFFDYEVDSDDEWEEEEPGESLHGSDDEDKESEDDYEVDNEFFVPHGYLSEEENNEENEMENDNHPETQKAKLKILQQEFNAEMKKKTEKIKPRLIGCIWTDINGNQEESCHKTIWNLLQSRAILCNGPIIMRKPESSINASPTGTDNGEHDDKPRKPKFTDEIVSDLIKLVHGNLHSREFLIKEFLAYQATKESGAEPFTKGKIGSKIKEISEWRKCTEDGQLHNKFCWNVSKEKLAEYDLQDIATPNAWSYILPPTRLEPRKNQESNQTNEINKDADSKVNTNLNITKFAKILTTEEKLKNFGESLERVAKGKPQQLNYTTSITPVSNSTPSSSNSALKAKAKKRVPLLMSVPCGQAIPETKKNNVINQFLMNGNNKTGANTTSTCVSSSAGKAKPSNESNDEVQPMDVDIIELD